MTAWALAYGPCVLLLLGLSALSFRRDRRSAAHLDFAAFSFLMALWLASLFLYYRVADEGTLTLVGRANFAAIALALCYGHLFARGLARRPAPRRAWILASLAVAALALLTPLVARREYLAPNGPATAFGPLFVPFALLLALHFAAAAWALAAALPRASAARRAQLRLVLAGFTANALVAMATNLVLPLAFGVFRYQEAGALSTVLLVAALGYAVLARGLLDVRVAVARTVVFAALVGALSALYGALLVLAGQTLSGDAVPRRVLLLNLGAVIAAGLASEPIRRWVAARTDRWLYQGDRERQAAAAGLGERLAWTSDLGDCLELVLGAVRSTLRPERAAVLAFAPAGEGGIRARALFGYREADDEALSAFSGLAPRLLRHPRVFEAAELVPSSGRGAGLAEALSAAEAEVAVPLAAGGRALGLVLVGRRMSGARPSLADLAFLELVRSSAVAAIQKAELADEGRAKTEFVSVASHELLTPITGVQGYLSMVLDEHMGEVDERARGYLTKANASARRLSALVRDLLSASRLEAGRTRFDLRPTDVAPIVRDAVDGVVPMAREKGLSVSVDLASGLPLAQADPDRLAEVLVNLVGNAVKYTPDGSVAVSAGAEGAFVRIEVRDTGLGMSEAARARLFEKFYRVRTEKTEAIPGTGLGLYVTKGMVERMGGRIEVESEERKGSAFAVFLPVAGGK